MNDKNIVVGVDFSEPSRAALREAAQLATTRHSALDIVHIIDAEFFEHEFDEKYLTKEQLTKQAEEALREFVQDTLDESFSPTCRAYVGHPFLDLEAHANTADCDLIVLGSYGNSGKADKVGTTAARFVRESPYAVLLVRERQRTPFKDVVACNDFSETSLKALKIAAELAVAHKAALHLLHVQTDGTSPFAFSYANPMLPPQYFDQYTQKFDQRAEGLLTLIREDYPELDAIAKTLRGPSVTTMICDYVKKINADLTVLGTRGRTGLKRLLIGTTAEKIIHRCPSSVLAVKPDSFGK